MRILTDDERETYILARPGIGASDLPAILEEDPWRSAFELFQIKTGAVQQPEANEAMLAGSKKEPEAVALAENLLSMKMEQQVIAAHDEFDYCYASADGWNAQERSYLEVKCPRSRRTIEYLAEHDQPPPHYMRQLEHQAAIFRPSEINFLVYHDADDYRLWYAGEEAVEMMIDRWRASWLPFIEEFQRAVDSGTWPKLTGKAAPKKLRWELAAGALKAAKEKVKQYEDEASGWQSELKRLSIAKVTETDRYKTEWRRFSPSFKVTVDCLNAQAAERVREALKPLAGADEVKKIEVKSIGESLRFFFTEK